MTFQQALDETVAILKRYGRVSYRGLKRQLGVDDEFIDDLRLELTVVLHLAADEDGTVLVWLGTSAEPAPAETAVGAPKPVTPAQPGAGRRPAERRHLTVMFADLADSTQLSSRLDPEDLRELMSAYQEMVGGITVRYGGHVAQYLGDGVLIYFGYPRAHEDDARRAIAAGLDIVEQLTQLNTRVAARFSETLAVRIGIHSGDVVVGDVGSSARTEQLALGETPNVAARVQGLATPNSVLVSGSIWHLAEGYFTGEALGMHTLKGVAQPLAIYRVVGESGAQTRLDVLTRGDLTPLVGRESESTLLLQRWQLSREGQGQLISLNGEAGIGKSRLVALLQEQAERDGARRITFRCSSYHSNSAFYPVIEQLGRLMHFEREDTPGDRQKKLDRFLAGYRFATETTNPLFARLLSVPWPDESAIAHLSPLQQRQRTEEALAAWLIEEAERQPVLTLWDDLHWADPSTLELLTLLIDHVPVAPVLMVMTFRPEFVPPWPPHSYLTQLNLNRLSHDETETMIARIAGASTLPAEVVQQIVAKTDGVPLFIEELVKMILESGLLSEQNGRYVLNGPLPPLAIPTTLQDSLMARLDRLATAREIAQVGAAIGRDFSHALIRDVAAIEEEALAQGLVQLIDAEVIFRRGRPPDATYFFKHALIKDAAYQSLLRSQRQLYHQRIADVLTRRFPEVVANEPEVLAHHYAEAGLHQHASVLWQRAAHRAIERSANSEAIAYLTRALEVVPLLPEGRARDMSELELRVSIGVPLIATRGYGNSEVERTFARARELAMKVGETPQLPNIIWGLWVFYVCGGSMRSALELAEQYHDLAQRHPSDSGLLLETCQLMGNSHFYMGNLAVAVPFFEQGSALYNAAEHHALIFAHGGADTGVSIMAHHALTLWVLGETERAGAEIARAVALAQQLAHPFSLAFAHYFHAWFHKLCGDDATTLASAGAALQICDEYDYPFWGMTAAALCGSSICEQGSIEEGIALMTGKLADFEATGGLLHLCALQGLLARSHMLGNRKADAIDAVAAALATLEGRDERWCEPELHRLHGEILLALGETHYDDAEAAFRTALSVAQRQNARAWELRVATSMAHLDSRRGRPDGFDLLAATLAGMPEGADSADKRIARQLLDSASPAG